MHSEGHSDRKVTVISKLADGPVENVANVYLQLELEASYGIL